MGKPPTRKGQGFGYAHIWVRNMEDPGSHPPDAFAFARTRVTLLTEPVERTGTRIAYELMIFDGDYHTGGGRMRPWRVVVSVGTDPAFDGYGGRLGIMTWYWNDTKKKAS